MKYIQTLLLLLFLVLGITAKAQNEIFNDISATKRIEHNEKWISYVSLNWKHIYSEIGWKRIGLEAKTTYQFNQWQVLGGLVNYYTFDPDIENYYELRPYAGLMLKTPVSRKIYFNQRIMSEWRNLYFANSTPSQHSGRLRYRIGADLQISETSNGVWKIRSETEWYLLNNLKQNERFINSKESSLSALREMRNDKTLSIGYRFERLNRLFYTELQNGHTIFLEYEF